jgi:hypothetical protein
MLARNLAGRRLGVLRFDAASKAADRVLGEQSSV